MTFFQFYAWNHSEQGRRSLEDIIRTLVFQLRACGYGAEYDPNNDLPPTEWNRIKFKSDPDDVNVMVEGFTPATTNHLDAARAAGIRLICLATEEPTEKGFNHGTQPEMVLRQEWFTEAAKNFEAIWHLVPGRRVTEWYARFAPTAYVELGYAPELVRPQRIVVPRFEFGFFGSMTERRFALLKKLARYVKESNKVRIVSDFATDAERNLAMQDAKVILQIRKFDEMGLVSSSRCSTALCLGRPVVAEPHDLTLSKPWDEIVKFARTDEEFIQLALLTRRHWRDAHHFQMERFKARLTPEVCVGRAVRETGLDDTRAAA